MARKGWYIMSCSRCGAEFAPRRSTARFCSTLCRVQFNRNRVRENVVQQYGGQCALAPRVDGEEAEGLEALDHDLGACHGALVVVGKRLALCAHHKGVLGEEKFKSKFEPEVYAEIRRQQGRERKGNAQFQGRVGGFVRGYRRPEKLGSKSSWRESYQKPKTLEDIRAGWDGCEAF